MKLDELVLLTCQSNNNITKKLSHKQNQARNISDNYALFTTHVIVPYFFQDGMR